MWLPMHCLTLVQRKNAFVYFMSSFSRRKFRIFQWGKMNLKKEKQFFHLQLQFFPLQVVFPHQKLFIQQTKHTFSCIFFRICVKYSSELTISVIFQAFSILIRFFPYFSDSNWKCGHTRGENYVFPTRVAMFPVFIRKMEKHRISMEKAGKSTSIVILPRSYTYSEEYTRE